MDFLVQKWLMGSTAQDQSSIECEEYLQDSDELAFFFLGLSSSTAFFAFYHYHHDDHHDRRRLDHLAPARPSTSDEASYDVVVVDDLEKG